MSRRPCSLADGVGQAPGKPMDEDQPRRFEALKPPGSQAEGCRSLGLAHAAERWAGGCPRGEFERHGCWQTEAVEPGKLVERLP